MIDRNIKESLNLIGMQIHCQQMANPRSHHHVGDQFGGNGHTRRAYPPILAVTSLNDTRVLYSEPAKWVARLRSVAPQGNYLLKIEMGAGHGGPSGRYDSWKEEAFITAWILHRVGLA